MVEPGQYPRVERIGSDLASLQKAVDGYIEAVYPYDDPVALICGEEAKLEGNSLSKLQEGREEEVETIRKAINYGFAVSEEQRQLVAAYDRVQEILGVTQKATQDYVNKLISEAQQAGYTGKALYDLVAAQITASNTKLNFSQQISALRTLAATIGYTTQA